MDNKSEYERDEMLNYLDGSTAAAESDAQTLLARFQAERAEGGG